MQHLLPLSNISLDLLKKHNNLLAFSAGTDSSALFFSLLDNSINFDIAIVDYNTREQSKDEILYAKTLAQQFNKKIYIKSVKLNDSNFEANARRVRYDFFKDLIKNNNYSNLVTAHHLNDKMEWFLMQLAKGAGVCELIGFNEIEFCEDFQTIRPMINLSKNEILDYLQNRNIKSFYDSSNALEKYQRNKIRKNFSNDFVKEYKNGIIRSFDYLLKDSNEILKNSDYKKIADLYILNQQNSISDIRRIDKVVKKLGYILSKKQRDEIEKTKECVVGNKITISKNDQKIFISPKCDAIMDKKFKELCRVLNIPSKTRPYLYKNKINPNSI